MVLCVEGRIRSSKKLRSRRRADVNKLKTLLETGVSFRAFAKIFLQEKEKENMQPTAYKTLVANTERVCEKIGHVILRNIDSDLVR